MHKKLQSYFFLEIKLYHLFCSLNWHQHTEQWSWEQSFLCNFTCKFSHRNCRLFVSFFANYSSVTFESFVQFQWYLTVGERIKFRDNWCLNRRAHIRAPDPASWLKRPLGSSPSSPALSLEGGTACAASCPAWDGPAVQQGTPGTEVRKPTGVGIRGKAQLCSVWDTSCKYQTALFSWNISLSFPVRFKIFKPDSFESHNDSATKKRLQQFHKTDESNSLINH